LASPTHTNPSLNPCLGVVNSSKGLGVICNPALISYPIFNRTFQFSRILTAIAAFCWCFLKESRTGLGGGTSLR